jgi:hypothetical protein
VVNNLVDVVDSLMVLDFANEVDVGTMLRTFLNKILSQFSQIGSIPGKRDGDIVHFIL